MPIKKDPLVTQCFRCKSMLTIRFVPPLKAYSHKYSWEFWTKDKKNEGKYICGNCLKRMYLNRKLEFRKFITDEKRRAALRSYISNSVF